MDTDVLPRAQRRNLDRHQPGGRRRSPHKSGRRAHTRSPYWAIRAAIQAQVQAERGSTVKQKRRWFHRAAEAVLHPVTAMRRQETSSRAAFGKGRPSRFQRGQR